MFRLMPSVISDCRNIEISVFSTRKPFALTPPVVLFLSLTVMLIPVHAQSATRGQIVLDVGNTWDGNRVFRPSVIYNGSLFLMWYSGGSGGSHNIGLATSQDGIAWTRYASDPNFAPNPVFTIGSSGDWDSASVDEEWVIHDNELYRMWYRGERWNPDGTLNSSAIGYATAPDGIHWTRYSGNPVLRAGAPGSFDDKIVWRPIVVPTGSGYVMYYRGASLQAGTQAKAGIATSADGIHWTKTGVLSMPPSASGWDAFSRQTGALNVGGVLKTGNIYVMGYDSIKTENSPQEIGFASSTDGTNWTPYPGNPVITYGSSGFDKAGVTRPMVVIVGDKYYVYYDAFENGSPDFVPDRIALAILPMDQYPIPEYPSNALVLLVATVLASIGLVALRNKRHEN